MPGRLIGKASTVNLTTMSRECHISAVLKLPLPEYTARLLLKILHFFAYKLRAIK
jgi:hypothetical protein